MHGLIPRTIDCLLAVNHVHSAVSLPMRAVKRNLRLVLQCMAAAERDTLSDDKIRVLFICLGAFLLRTYRETLSTCN